jgi:Tol biopolymer transport system component
MILGRRFLFLPALILGLFVAGTLATRSPRAEDGKPPEPEMIGEGVISTPDDEFGGAFSADGQTIYFDKTVAPHYLYIICSSHFSASHWSRPEILSFSGVYRDSDPVLSPDGQTLFFASDRPFHGRPSKNFHVFAAKMTAKGWSDPEALEGPVNSEGSQDFASIANNGNIYFTSDRQNERFDVYRSRLVGGKYLDAENLAIVNGEGISSLEALVAPDESYLLIGSFGRPDGLGNSDLYISYNVNGAWTAPKNLGPVINTRAREYSPRVTPDGKWLIFTSERGITSEKRDAPFTYSELTEKARGVLDGLGNIYRIPMDYVLRTTRP